MNCTACGKEVEKLETWGNHAFCPKCSKRYSKDWKEAPEHGANNIKIKIKTGPDAQYDPDEGSIIVLTDTEDVPSLCVWFQHEAMHWVLHGMIGIRGTFQYDHFSKHSELEWWTRGVS